MVLILKKIHFLNFFKNLNSPRRLLKPRSFLQLFIILILVYLCYVLGLFTHMLEKDLDEFRYPLKVDVRIALDSLYNDQKSAKNIDINKQNYTFIHKADQTCTPIKNVKNDEQIYVKPYLVILVKSKYNHFEQRDAIRRTWGKSDEFKLIRTVFLIGLPDPQEEREKTLNSNDQSSSTDKLESENEKYKDLIQQNFFDTYYNNTIKTFMGIRWINEYCQNAKFYLFIDDDFYLNPNLLMRFLIDKISESMLDTLYAGFVFPNSSPMRHKFSKWYISLQDYPYHKFPPFVAAGCYILSRKSAEMFFLASKLIEFFKFDDIYMGLLAHKLDIKPYHMESVHFWAPTYLPSVYAKEIIAAHKFPTTELLDIWSQLELFIKFQSSSSTNEKYFRH